MCTWRTAQNPRWFPIKHFHHPLVHLKVTDFLGGLFHFQARQTHFIKLSEASTGAFVSASINYARNKEEEGRSRPIPALLQPSPPFPGSLRKDTGPERNRRGLRLPMAPKKRLLLLRPHFTQLKAQRCFKGTKRLDWWRARASPDGCREEGAGSVLQHRSPQAFARTSAR